MGLCISSSDDLMFSSLPCARNTPYSSDAGISFLSRVFKLIVCGLHLHNHSLESLNSSGKMASLFCFQLCVVVES